MKSVLLTAISGSFLLPVLLSAQTLITNATYSVTDYADSSLTLGSTNYTFENTVVSVDTVTTNTGQTYAFSGQLDTVIVRYGSTGTTTANMWYETDSSGNVVGTYYSDISDALLNNNLSTGVQNLFGNAGASNYYYASNVERVDFMTSATSGFAADAGWATVVFDLGYSGNHDVFKIALITGVDAFGNPTSYSTLVASNAAGANNVYDHDTFTLMYYSDASDGDLETTNYTSSRTVGVSQGAGGLLFTLADFGVNAGTTIYGYSLFGYDVSGNGSQLADWTNTTYFPTNTAGADNTSGGFDFASVNGIVFSLVPEPSSYAIGGMLVLGIATVVQRQRRKTLQKKQTA